MNGAKKKLSNDKLYVGMLEQFEERRLALVSHPFLLPQNTQAKLFLETGEIEGHVISHH